MQKLPLALALVLAAGSASAAQVWVAPAAQKIRPAMTAPANAPTSAAISGAQNEFEAFQIVVTGAATNVSMAFEGLTNAAGDTISGREVVLYREAFINVAIKTGGDGAIGMWPDALVPDVDPIMGEKRNAFPFSVAAGSSSAVFVDIHAPDGAPAGVYRGVVHVTGGVTADVPVSLTVWDFALPSTSTLKSAFGLAWNGPCMGHGNAHCNDDFNGEMALRARYVQSALDNRVSIQQPYYTATITSTGTADWSIFDQYAGPFLDGTANTRLIGAKLTSTSVNGASTVTQNNGWTNHFALKGWSSVLFNYVCDEPPATCAWSDITPGDAAAHSVSPKVTTLVTTTPLLAAANGASGIDIFAPVINFVEGKPGQAYAGNQRSNYPATMWWYQSCMSYGCGGGTDTGWPTMAIDSDATRNRALEWLSYVYNVQGEVYFETTFAFFDGDAWTRQYDSGGNGDGTLFYPGTVAKIGGTTEIPVESLRLKMIRDGMEDYELLHLATSLGLGAQAMQIAKSVYPKTYLATTTPQALEGAREELATMILQALGKNVTTPAPDAGAGGPVVSADAGAGGPVVSADAGTPVATADAGDTGTGSGTDT